jgi:hypothetical protein
MLDFNSTATRNKTFSDAMNAAMEKPAPSEMRNYLGGSALGKECLRQIHWDWRKPSTFSSQTLAIFQRGHWAEAYTAERMRAAGFRMLRNVPRLGFTQLGGKFKGHGDGLILDGPAIEGAGYPCLWECKCLGDKGFKKILKDGLRKAYMTYFVQVQIYMAYLDLTDHPTIFTVVNANTMERTHFLVPFEPDVAQEWSDKALMIVKADEAGETLPRITDDPTDFRCRFCSHKEECHGL